eukprot:6049632-Pleurochrysis_carterae.AAC.2
MPLDAVDARGNVQRLTLRNVRCVPSFRDSLLSVSQLWESASMECRFGSTLTMLSPPPATGGCLALPFGRSSGLYAVWRVILRDAFPSAAGARAMAIHASRSKHHVEVMSPQDATICLHRRIHVGASRLRSPPKLTSDAPPSLSSGRLDSCAACAEANSPRLPHTNELY